MSSIERFQLLGVSVDALTRSDLHELIAESVLKNERRLILNHNLHSICLCHRDQRMAQTYEDCDFIYVDGLPIIFLGRMLGLELRSEHRITFLDSFDLLAAEATRRNWRLFYLGSKPGVAQRGAQMLLQRFPALQIATAHGFFDSGRTSRENLAVLSAINRFRPHILMVGMGMPRQEHWIQENLGSISANAIFTCGATMDYLTGEIRTPPRWAGPLGAYGLVRLLHEPRRLWRRYLLEPWFIGGLFVRDMITGAKAEPRPERIAGQSLGEEQASAD